MQAANTLAAIGDVAVPALNGLLAHEDQMIRLAAASALGHINRGRDDAFKILVDGLQFIDVPFRDAVGGWGANHEKYEGINEVVKADGSRFRNREDGLRASAARFLGALGPAAAPAVPELITALKNPRYSSTREAAADALGKIGPAARAAVPALLETARAGEGRGASFAILRFVGTAFVWTIALLMLLANLGVNITAMVTGLGIGGVAGALAVQNILGDLVASLSIALDKPFAVGDAIQVDDLVGSVENVGIKSTRIRSVGGEQIVISNAQLLGARLRNFGRAEQRRAFYTIGVTYGTPPEKLRQIPGMVEQIVTALPNARFERCHFRTLGDSALLYEIAFYSLDGELMPLVELQQEFNIRLIEAFRGRGIEFAYPTMKQFTVEVPRYGLLTLRTS